MLGEDFTQAAADFPDPFRLLIRESVASTNDEIQILAKAGAPEGLIVLTGSQTAGRGRRGAAWFSATDESLAFSILLRPEEPKALWPRLALAAGLAVAEGIEYFGVRAGIKWPNDVWIGDRKVAGILVEAGVDFAVVGIGLNVNTHHFPEGIREIATSLQMETAMEISRAEVLLAIIRRFSIRRGQIDADFPTLVQAVSTRCVLTGKLISLLTADGARRGIMDGISPNGELILKTTMGYERLIQADEIRLLNH